MRRFEFEDSKSHKFWEIEVEGKSFTVRFGKVGTEGQVQTKTFASEAKAELEAEKKIEEKTKKGYVEVAGQRASSAKPKAKQASASAGPGKPIARNPELEAAIIADPSSAQAWSVYADWLQGQGDPWGERLGLEIAREGADAADKRKLGAAIKKLEQAHVEHFQGAALAKLMAAEDFKQLAKLEWKHGFIVRARVGVPGNEDEEDEWEGTKPAALLQALVASPAARFLRSLRIGLLDYEPPCDLDVGIEALCSAGPLPALTELFIGDFEYPDEQEISWVEVGNVAKLLELAPNLRSLHLRGRGIGLGKELVHDRLEQLRIETGGLPASSVKALGQCKLPALRRMEVWLGTKNYGGNGTIEMLAPLFSGEGLPKLEHLGLQNSDFENEIAIELAESPLLARLETVSLSMGTLHDVGGKAILDNAKSFAHLKSLDLDHNYLSDAMAKALKKALAGVVKIGATEAPSDWGDGLRYFTEVGE